MTRVNFEKVEMWGEKRVKCADCGKWLKRSKTIFQTINPFNKAADGSAKDRFTIRAELVDALNKWRAEPEMCSQCAIRSFD